MAGLLKLPGTTAASKDGYASLDQPIKQHTVSAGGIKDVPIELGDLANDVYFDEVARIRDAIRALDDTISTLQTKQAYSLQAPGESLAVEIATLSSRLSQDISWNRSRIAELGQQVGKDEARRGHWENLKAALQRIVEKWQRAEQSHREKVRDKIGRQMRIVNPDVTDEEVKQAVDTSAGAQAQVFQQAIMGARSAAAKSALTEAESRRSELVQIEETLVQLAALMQQVADLVVQQDVQITHIESTAAGVEADVEQGVKQIGLAKVSAAAARHKRKMCAAFGFLLLLVLIIVVVIEMKQGGGGGGGGKEEAKTETVSAAASATSHAARYR